MKAILVIDMPKGCRDCDCAFKFAIIGEKYECNLINDGILTDGRNKRNDCPLKPMPQKQDATEIAIEIEKFKVDDKLMYQVEGWNRCIDEILGVRDGE